MRFYGDPGMELSCPTDGIVAEDSITAMVRTFTPDGFVIAADGRETDPADKSVITDQAQKIFPIHSRDGQFALSLCSVRKIANDGRTELLFDLQEELLAATEELRLAKTRSALEYVQPVADRVLLALSSAAERDKPAKYPDPGTASWERGRTLSRVHFDGYFGGFPAIVEFRLWHEDQQSLRHVQPLRHCRLIQSAISSVGAYTWLR